MTEEERLDDSSGFGSESRALAADSLPGASEDALAPRLWAGDAGELPFKTRQLLVTLLRGPYLTRERHNRLWDEMLASERIVRSRLADLFLTLVIDDETGIAFCRSVELDQGDAPSLLHVMRLRFFESVVILELRDRLLRATDAGERAMTTVEEIREILRTYDRTSEQNAPRFEQRLSGVIHRLKARRLLLPLKGEGRLEVSPALSLLFTATDIAALRDAYAAKAARLAGAEERDENDEHDIEDDPLLLAENEASDAADADKTTGMTGQSDLETAHD